MNKKIFFTVAIIAMVFISKAQTWDSLGSGPGGWAEDMCIYNGNLIVGGYLGGSHGYGVTQWNGTSWAPIGTGMNVQYSGHYVSALAAYNGNLFAGGAFDTAGGIHTGGIAQWNGTSWSTVGAIVNPTFVACLAVYNGNLYAGGVFDSIGGVKVSNIAEWNGTNWSALDAGTSSSGEVFSLAVYNGELYAGGSFDSAGGIAVHNIAKWNGTNWSAVGRGIRDPSYTNVNSLCVYEGKLYVAGTFDSAGGVFANNIAVWNGTTWSAVGGGTNTSVYSLTVFNHELFAGGPFTQAGAYTSYGVAQWDGYSWSPLSSEYVGPVYSLAVYNSSLIVGGSFTKIGTLTCNGTATWSGGPFSEANVCYVSVDTASKYNVVYWDKASIDTALVDSIRIYRKGFNGYDYAGHVSIHNYTEFIDSGSHPTIESSTYELSTVDSSGLLSQLSSNPNQTMLLQASKGVRNTVNLIWNPYVGDSVTYYVILRDSDGNGNWKRYDSVPNNDYSFIDNYPPVSPNLRYEINTAWNLNCAPYAPPVIRGRSMTKLNPYISHSNITELSITGIPTTKSLPDVNIYPNPSKDVVFITLSEPTESTLALTNVLGQEIYSDKFSPNEKTKQINLTGINNGIYFLKLTFNSGSEIVKKIEVVR